MFTPPDITIQPATISDVPTLSKIQQAAYKADLVSHIMTLDRPEDWSYEDWLRRTIEPSFQDRSIAFIKAVENSTGRIVGWSYWAIKDGGEKKSQESDRAKSEPKNTASPSNQSAKEEVGNASSAPSAPSKLPRQKLSALIAVDSVAQYTTYMSSKNEKHLTLQGLFVLPTSQGRGIGTALITHCTQKADSENLSCWVHASPASWWLYEKAGFREVGRKDFNLADFVGRGAGNGWGGYLFRYMVREAER